MAELGQAFGNFRREAGKDSAEAVLERLAAGEDDGPSSDESTKKEHPLDSDANKRLLSKLRSWHDHEKDLQLANRIEQAIDADFYDHLQWREEDAAVLRERKQAPLVFNLIFQTINWLIGTELRMKKDWRVLPRERDDEKLAPVKQKMLKWLSDANRAPQVRSAAAEDMFKVGIGWIDHAVNFDPTRPIVRIGYESWRNVWRDSYAVQPDGTDARYVFRDRWVDEDMALAMFRERHEVIKGAINDRDATVDNEQDPINPFNRWGDSSVGRMADLTQGALGTSSWSGVRSIEGLRNRLRLTEAWYRVPQFRSILRGEVLNGAAYDANNPLHERAIKEGVCSLVGGVQMEVRYAIYCAKGLLAQGTSPYKHNRFPLVPMICYIRDKDRQPYGAIRGMRDSQEDYNKRASKSLHLMSTKRVVFDEGAFEDEDEAREQMAAADTFVAKRKGYEVKVETDLNVAQAHVALMDRDERHLENTGGVTNELMARNAKDASGIAIERRQAQGQLTTTKPFESIRFATQESGQIVLSMAEQFITEPTVIRITGAKPGEIEWVKINEPQYNPQTEQYEYLNDITKTEADFVMDEQDWRESVRQAQFEQLMNMLAKWPWEVAVQMLDLALELGDFHNKDEFIKRAREINGRPPPADQLSPEEAKAQQEAAALQQQMNQMKVRAAEAELEKLLADVAKARAEGRRIDAQALQLRMSAITSALTAASQIVLTPAIAPSADSLLADSGFPEVNVPQAVGGMAPPVMPAMPVNGGRPTMQGV